MSDAVNMKAALSSNLGYFINNLLIIIIATMSKNG